MMVIVFVPMPMDVLMAPLNRTWKVSVLSRLRSSTILMDIKFVVSPGAKVNVPFDSI